MKTQCLAILAVLGVLFIGPGCGWIEVAPAGKAERVLTGTINAGVVIPAGAEVVVRLMAAAGAMESMRPAGGELPVITRPVAPTAERVLGEHTQKLSAGTMEPVPFRIEYQADDAVLRRGLNVEARVSHGGKLRFRTINAHVVTLASSPYRQDVSVQPVER